MELRPEGNSKVAWVSVTTFAVASLLTYYGIRTQELSSQRAVYQAGYDNARARELTAEANRIAEEQLTFLRDGKSLSRSKDSPNPYVESDRRAVQVVAPIDQPGPELIATGRGEIRPPGSGKQNYKLYKIDLSSYESGSLVVEVDLGNGSSAGSFDLFRSLADVPTEGRPDKSLAGAYDISSGRTARLEYRFANQKLVYLGTEGNWGSPDGSRNTIEFRAFVKGGTKAMPF